MKLQWLLPSLALLLCCPGHVAVDVQSKVLRRGSAAATDPGDDIADRASEAREKAAAAKDAAKERAVAAKDAANDRASAAKERAAVAKDAAKERALKAKDEAKEKAVEAKERAKDAVKKVERLDYNRETYVAGLPLSIEFLFASVFVALVGSVPFVIVVLMGGGNMTKAHIIESACLVIWLVSALVSFCKVLEFNSAHWDGSRSLTVVEAVYLLSQILTTVGYGDITPAHPFSQVWVAVNVLLAMLLYGSVIMECTTLVSAKLALALEKGNPLSPRSSATSNEEGRRTLRDWHAQVPPVDFRGLVHSFSAFLVLATIGVVFYHFFPGEGKTWLQSVYMSVITLSTVGFGWFNATSEGGKVFGAFWMLFGVAALAATITHFVELMTQIKAREQKDASKDQLNFFKLVQDNVLVTSSGADKGMDRYSFIKFGLMLRGAISEEDLEVIENRFAKLSAGQDRVSLAVVMEAESPPRAFHDEKDRRT